MILAHRIRLVPTAEQAVYFTRKRLNAIKYVEFPWMRDVTKNAPQQAIKNLGRAYTNFFEGLMKYRRGDIQRKRVRVPRFKKKGRNDSFRADNGTDKQHPHAVSTAGMCVKLPIAGWVRMREAVRFSGRILSVVISRQAAPTTLS